MDILRETFTTRVVTGVSKEQELKFRSHGCYDEGPEDTGPLSTNYRIGVATQHKSREGFVYLKRKVYFTSVREGPDVQERVGRTDRQIQSLKPFHLLNYSVTPSPY